MNVNGKDYILLCCNLKVDQNCRNDKRNNSQSNKINYEQRIYLPCNSCKRSWTRRNITNFSIHKNNKTIGCRTTNYLRTSEECCRWPWGNRQFNLRHWWNTGSWDYLVWILNRKYVSVFFKFSFIYLSFYIFTF